MRDRIDDGLSEFQSAILPADGMISAGRPGEFGTSRWQYCNLIVAATFDKTMMVAPGPLRSADFASAIGGLSAAPAHC
jgi:hypothetical protein